MSWSDIALYFGLPFGALVAIAVGLLLSPLGPVVLAYVANSRVAQIALAIGTAGLGILMLRQHARAEGRRQAQASAEEENRQAVERRRQVERDVQATPVDRKRRELEGWGDGT